MEAPAVRLVDDAGELPAVASEGGCHGVRAGTGSAAGRGRRPPEAGHVRGASGREPSFDRLDEAVLAACRQLERHRGVQAAPVAGAHAGVAGAPVSLLRRAGRTRARRFRPGPRSRRPPRRR